MPVMTGARASMESFLDGIDSKLDGKKMFNSTVAIVGNQAPRVIML